MANDYAPASDEVIAALTAIVGAEGVLRGDEEMRRYSLDEMAIPKPHLPDCVVRPADTAQVAQVLRLANERGIAVTPRGGGTGVCGGCVPVYGGIVLSLEAMNRIVEIDADNFVAVVEPGVVLSDLYRAVEGQGLYYPLYPGELSATIGGNVATNAGGMRAVKYGVTRNFVVGLQAVLPTGEVIETGGRLAKCSSGYDLTQLIVGSEGTLAVVTRIILKLIPPPGRREVLFIPFARLPDAIGAVPDILAHGILPVGIEFMERDIIQIVEQYLEREVPFHEHEAFLMIIVEGADEEAILEQAQRIEEVCQANGAIEVFVPGSERAKRELLEARERFYPAVRATGPVETADVVVPRSAIPQFVARAKEIAVAHQMTILAFGHAGDGNVHLSLLGRGMEREEWERRLPAVFADLYHAGVSLGGAVSGEHGIGLDKKGYLAMTMEREKVELMKRIKRAFDPNHILNPGKLFE
ncbi:MAG: FAD-linked oxidase C-terminal domain-containing protein [Chloroflexota bacterium]|nr:FAD-linked oxidase C-terminal domain-containing protein [Chloroflexota bacterium]